MSFAPPLVLTAQKPAARAATSAPVIVVGVTDGDLEAALAHPSLLHDADELRRMAVEEHFVGRAKQQLIYRAPVGNKCSAGGAHRVVLLGVGLAGALSSPSLLRLGGTATRLADGFAAKTCQIVPPADLTAAQATALCQGLQLGVYRYTAYRGKAHLAQAAKNNEGVRALSKVFIGIAPSPLWQEAIRVGNAFAAGVALARDLVNCPPNVLYPEAFARTAKKLAAEAKMTCKVLAGKQLAGMGMLEGVGQGSARPPRLVHVSYRGTGAKGQATALIGKGITFDSGGLCIKTCDGMGTMKMDMGGAAAVLATLMVAATLKLPCEVHGVLALAENMPSSNALRTGDVLHSAAGITVEVNNTDAEGRLVLGDAIHYAKKHCNPVRLVDVATLTGACMVALGQTTTGLFSNDDTLADGLRTAGALAGEDLWRMPLTPSLKDQLKSDVADMRNTGDRYGGAITAALFLQAFVGKTPWAHLDIAGPAWTTDDSASSRRGGTGTAVSTLSRLLMDSAPAPKRAKKATLASGTRPPRDR